MTAEIIKLDDINDPEGEFYAFLDELKGNQKRGIFLLVDKENNIRLGSTAKSAPEMLVMTHHLRKMCEYMADEYASALFIEDEDEEEE